MFRSRDYESLVELGAKIGVKIRERDEGGGNKAKVRGVSSFTVLHIHVYLSMSHDLTHMVGLCELP